MIGVGLVKADPTFLTTLELYLSAIGYTNMTFENFQVGQPVKYHNPGNKYHGQDGEVVDVCPNNVDCVKVFFPKFGVYLYIFKTDQLVNI